MLYKKIKNKKMFYFLFCCLMFFFFNYWHPNNNLYLMKPPLHLFTTVLGKQINLFLTPFKFVIDHLLFVKYVCYRTDERWNQSRYKNFCPFSWRVPIILELTVVVCLICVCESTTLQLCVCLSQQTWLWESRLRIHRQAAALHQRSQWVFSL